MSQIDMKNMDTMELINTVSEFNDIHKFMEDEQVDRALAIVVKIMLNPDVPPQKAVPLIAELQAMSSKFAVLATWYATVNKGPAGSINHTKKNVYYSLRDAMEKLADSLKYSARLGIYG